VGRRWFDRFRMSIPDETIATMHALGFDAGLMWAGLIGVLATAPVPHDPASIIKWLAEQDGAMIRLGVLKEKLWEAEPDDLKSASGGDPEATQRLMCCSQIADLAETHRQALQRFLVYPTGSLSSTLAAILAEIREVAFEVHEAAWASVVKAQAAATRAEAAANISPSELIERITNGISYDIPFGITRLVLVPSVTLKPWTMVTDFGDVLIVMYPVAEEHLATDPESPPAWLVNVYRALGDEKRLRLLRRLSQDPASLADLTEFLGLAKSTVFHHIGVLRGAGLIRVQLGADKSPVYSLRLDAFPDFRNLLDTYLSPAGAKGVS
jgi:DNA-binding transcriptional ArsR family regulator/uncharacterized membrane protein